MRSGRHDFRVSGFGSFPMDMLRYDECFPLDSDSAQSIADSHAGPSMRWEIRLGTYRPFGPTIDRWRSFNWAVRLDD